MPYKDPEIAKQKARERKRRYRAKKHAEIYGQNAGAQRGKHGKQPTASRHPRWKAKDKIISEHGYVKVRVGVSHPLSDPNGYAYEHLIVWASAGRERPGPDEVIHHVNEDKTDTRIENLQLLKRSEHSEMHTSQRARDSAGRLLDGREWNEFPQVEVQ